DVKLWKHSRTEGLRFASICYPPTGPCGRSGRGGRQEVGELTGPEQAVGKLAAEPPHERVEGFPGLAILGVQVESVAQVDERLRELPLSGQQFSEVAVSVGEIRLAADRDAKGFDGALLVSLLHQTVADHGVGLSAVGFELCGLTKAGEGAPVVVQGR